MFSGESDKGASPVGDDANSMFIPAAITDTGCERDLNEDRYAVIESASGLAWLVCDGMGGTTGGELAAQLAIDGIRRDLEGLPQRPIAIALKSAILEANRIIVLRRQNQAFAQMGTTVVGAIFDGQELAIGHVGDSRAYLVRSGRIEQLTIDHTYVQELVDKGQIRPEEALSHPQAHILTRAIGSEPGLQVDIDRFWIWDIGATETPDLLLLCTDGLYSHVADVEIARIVSAQSPQAACVQLVELAKSRGGFDNITVAIVPLTGHLKREAPIGYEDRKVAIKNNKRVPEQRSPMGKTLLLVALLSLLFCMLVVLSMAFSLS